MEKVWPATALVVNAFGRWLGLWVSALADAYGEMQSIRATASYPILNYDSLR